MRVALPHPCAEAPFPLLVMAGLDPAIQTGRHGAAVGMGWMAASRAAMTNEVRRLPGAETPFPTLVMAGLDPAIQTGRQRAAVGMGWMAASRAAMTSWAKVHKSTEREIYR
ncbi:hypothetical protein G5V57_20690 [Nordella sp. HKS 07]|uniref:hypothetical protein n=1 Tax=Nordella sp. HKS 07 TaxID=2712222 RepID=UPI0013E1978E|nr:hypothetical protein [Nordella sp. HKS 07]QIG47522.1 hypothetical protein G5V57_07135 [Nordella sp. HKS 07]QIG49928.1 hypothetical protein G5V57_20690 [Nordella sp. HKS 07]